VTIGVCGKRMATAHAVPRTPPSQKDTTIADRVA
jgi:hypothetical protein